MRRKAKPEAEAIEITPAMIEAGSEAFRYWERQTDEPDDRIMIVEVLKAVLGERATFC